MVRSTSLLKMRCGLYSLTLFACVLGRHDALAQEFNKRLDYNFGIDRGESVAFVQNEGYLLAGVSWDTAVNGGIVLYKLDLNGDEIWVKKYGKAGHNYFVASTTRTSDGNLVIAGSYGDQSTGNLDFYWMKVTLDGDSLWFQNLSVGPEWDVIEDVIETSDNGLALVGRSENFGGPQKYKVYMIKSDDAITAN